MCPDPNLCKSLNVGCSDLIASSTYNQNAPRSEGSGNVSAAKGLIYAKIDFRSLAGKYDSNVVRSHGGVEAT